MYIVWSIQIILITELISFVSSCLVQALRDFLGWYCADLSTSMKFGTDVDQNILNSFFEGAEAGAHLGHHICRIQDGRLPLFDLIITL